MSDDVNQSLLKLNVGWVSVVCVTHQAMLTAAVTLHRHSITDIQFSEQAAAALRPLAGEFALVLFATGIVGTGLLAVPVLGLAGDSRHGDCSDHHGGNVALMKVAAAF